MPFVDSYIVFRVFVADLKRLKINLKIKIRFLKCYFRSKKKKKIIIPPLKFVVYKFEKSAAPLMRIWICLTFVLMKTSFVFVFRRRLDQDECVRLSLSSSEDVLKTSSRRLGQDQYICLGHASSRRLQDVLKTSSRRLAKISSRRFQDVSSS